MQGINAGNACYPERAFSSRFCQQFFLIIVGNNKPAEDKKKLTPTNPSLKKWASKLVSRT